MHLRLHRVQTPGGSRGRGTGCGAPAELPFLTEVAEDARRSRRTTSRPAARSLGGAELVYLRVQRPLSARARREVYRRISGLALDAVPPVVEIEDAIKLDIRDLVAEIRERMDELERIKRAVTVDPAIRGGEPVFRGTRIPVHPIADFLARGVPAAELLEDHPALSTELLEAARRSAELYPRRGRPRQAPWRAGTPTHVFAPEDLRD